MKSNNKMQLIEPCEICIQDKELLDEIVGLNEHVSELEAAIYDLENQIVELKHEVNSIYPNLIVELKQELYSVYPNLILKKS